MTVSKKSNEDRTNDGPGTTKEKSKKRYAIWNNKGGVGKTFLTFTIATEYAIKHSNEIVVVVDMCPQANISEMLLGGNATGSWNLGEILKRGPSRRSIGGYFDKRIAQPHKMLGTETVYFTKTADFNSHSPKNIYLVAGDPSLELQTPTMNQIASQDLPFEAWRNVHYWVHDLLTAFETQPEDKDFVFFLDCNPSFSIYTEQAILAANRLIVPCTADGSSARAIDNLAKLIYGIGMPTQYSTASISDKAVDFSMPLPQIHAVLFNRATQYDKKASKAFGAMHGEIQNRVNNISYEYMTTTKDDLFFDVPDTHSVSIVSSHHGMPLRDIRTRKYDIHGIDAQVNKNPLERYKSAIGQIVQIL